MKMKKTIFAPYLMLVFAFIGMTIASYDVSGYITIGCCGVPPPSTDATPSPTVRMGASTACR